MIEPFANANARMIRMVHTMDVGIWFNTNMLLKREGWLLQVKEDVNMMGDYFQVLPFIVNSPYILIVQIVRIFTNA